ncbi:MAG: 30S ribosome-binding factor RbfA [Syntrophales bacterium]|jgi:ribosome-binding factor A|nr:30S ribosome-binding factor RbfA [Syntrophales bacterium]NLN59933.1 30S ribosome-binding factor RbfA [Deltaproteobacteria bacterium]
MTNFKRADRVAELIQSELAEILLKEIRDPRIGLLTITGVKVSDDLRVAKVFFVEMGRDVCRQETWDGLKKAAGFIRKGLGRRLQLRYVPEIIFRQDPSFAYGSRIDRILMELESQNGDHAAKNH